MAVAAYALDYPDSMLAFSGLEQAFLQLEREVPGFAGFYRENESLVLLSTQDPDDKFVEDLSRKLDHARTSGLLEKASFSPREIISRTQRVAFRFRDLTIWRLRIRDGIMSLPGVTSLDLDERANRIAIGVEPDADRTRIVAFLATTQVPESAVDIRLDPENQTAQSLATRIRPLTAGDTFRALYPVLWAA